MIGLALALALAAQEGPGALEAGLRAFQEERYEEAARLLAEATAGRPCYEGLLTLGLARGRLGQYAQAAEALGRAIAFDPRRPEAWVERGGLRFLERDYSSAVRDLERALSLHEDAYTRDLLASSLHLAGRTDEALAHWNVLGQPVVRTVEIQGLVHTRDRVARRELALEEGRVLDLELLRESRLRLAEVGIFDRMTLRPVPRGEGRADLEVALVERHGFFRNWSEFVVATGVGALGGRVRLRYTNLAGLGVSLGGQYRWQRNRPELSLLLDWPRPLGLPAYLHVQGFRGRQAYELDDGPLRRSSRGLDVRLRGVLGGRTVGQIGLSFRDRSFSRPRADAPPGTIIGIEAGLERRLLDRHRHRLAGALNLFHALELLGSEVRFGRALATLEYRAFIAPPEGTAFERSVLAARLRWGGGGSGMPVDEMFAPGGSLEMELPLRAHRQMRRGILGATPLGRSLVLANIEWRRRLVATPLLQMGFVSFYDGARLGGTTVSSARTFHDLGVGLRLAFLGSPIIRIDYAHGLGDGKNALFAGLNHVF